ncbi:Amidase [Macleaya cordata]|uniref:Amidase n=1 Tax=Macleaya cordata TaxID=56857 RepID=A0A200Q021_MACCD|nr:Amidase [Macleaya cordata]
MVFYKDEGLVYKPVEEIDLSPNSNETYLKSDVKAPRMAGIIIKIFTWILELRGFGTMVLYILKRDNLIHKLVSYAKLKEPPVYVPSYPWEDLKEKEVKSIQPDLSPLEQVQEAIGCLPEREILNAEPSFRRWTIQDYSRSYTSGETTPLMVAKRFLDAVHESSNPPLQMSFFINYNSEDILKQATESTHRYEQGKPISILDGVPIAIKDEIDCMPYPTTGGTTWLHKLRPCTNDACCVEHLRSCGAMLIGKSNMHELGAGTSGINPHYGAARNPYDINRISGGSSSGSATLVSAGLCPVALGVDGGGSVRMPAALCGVVGLKPGFGRVPHSGVLPLNWTVGMVGILAATVEDALIVYAAISGHSPSNPPTSLQPKVDFPLLKFTNSISNIKMAKYGEWFNDCKDEIKNCCYEALDLLCMNYGWKTVEMTIPEIETMRLAHYITIGSECNASLNSHPNKFNRTEIGWDARVALRVYGAFSSREYLNAQRIRNRQMHIYKNIFKFADVIVTPTTGVTAFPITETAIKYGEFDYINGAALVRYQIAGNFLGLPAVTVPVGYDKHGMPIGLQFIGRPWSEPTLIHISFAMQSLCISSYKKPQVFYDLLGKGEVRGTTSAEGMQAMLMKPSTSV